MRTSLRLSTVALILAAGSLSCGNSRHEQPSPSGVQSPADQAVWVEEMRSKGLPEVLPRLLAGIPSADWNIKNVKVTDARNVSFSGDANPEVGWAIRFTAPESDGAVNISASWLKDPLAGVAYDGTLRRSADGSWEVVQWRYAGQW